MKDNFLQVLITYTRILYETDIGIEGKSELNILLQQGNNEPKS